MTKKQLVDTAIAKYQNECEKAFGEMLNEIHRIEREFEQKHEK